MAIAYDRQDFIKWIREVINSQASLNGNAVSLNDYSKDGMSEFLYPKTFIVNGDEYSWDIGLAHTKGRHLTTHYELWFNGKAFSGTKKIETGELTLTKVRKGLKEIFEYYLVCEYPEFWMSTPNFKAFQSEIKSIGNVWSSKHVYFQQNIDGYSAKYKPKYPNGSIKDMIIQTIYGSGAYKRGNYELMIRIEGKYECVYFKTIEEIRRYFETQ